MEAKKPLSSNLIYPYIHRFLLELGASLPSAVNSQEVFAELFGLCRRVMTDQTPGENLASRYFDELQQRTGNRRVTELILCLGWVVLSVQEHPTYSASSFAQKVLPLIKHSLYYNKARQLAITIRQHERHIHTDFLVSPKPYPDMLIETEYQNPVLLPPGISRKRQKPEVDIEVVRQEILTWVSRVRPHLADAWKADFMKIWGNILNMQEVKEKVYNPGKQKKTNFNQYLVGNILYYLFDECGAWSEDEEYNASAVCMTLVGTTEHQLRKELAKNPPEEIKNCLLKYFKKKFKL